MIANPETKELTLTPNQIEGPYYRMASPHRDNLIEPGITGIPFKLSGRVVNQKGQPMPGAILDFWQSDDEGNYDMIGYRLHGHVFADEQGRYEITTIYPACYEPRQARHIHVKLQCVSQPLTTQIYFSDDEDRLKDHWYLKETEVQMQEDGKGGKIGTLDFVIKQVTERENVTKESLAATLK